jgi:hypothetical protein
MAPTDITKNHVIRNYIEPARLRGEKTVTVRVGKVLKELGWTNRTPSVFSTLSSQPFQREAGVVLLERKGGPASGGPSTTVQFVYGLNEEGPAGQIEGPGAGNPPSVTSLLNLYGIFADGYRELGGAEAFMKQERDWGPDAWERSQSDASHKSGEKS